MGSGTPDLVVVGGGLIGCAVAWETARRGLAVTVIERERPGAGASGAAAGMLSPLPETPAADPLHELAEASFDLFADFVAELQDLTGFDVGHRTDGKLHIALDRAGEAALRDSLGWRAELGHPAEWLEPGEILRLEPALTPDLRGGIFDPRDHQVENRLLTRAAWAAAAAAGVEMRTGEVVAGISVESGRVTGVRLATGGVLHAGSVLIAAGAWSGTLEGLPRPLPVRPVRGQIVVLESVPPALRRMVGTDRAYLVPRSDGRLLVGATTEEAGFDLRATAGGAGELLAAAIEVIPGLADAGVVELRVGLRPGTADGLPILGADPECDGLYYAAGHFRNGILLAPITARLLAESITGGRTSHSLAPFAPGRFTTTG